MTGIPLDPRSHQSWQKLPTLEARRPAAVALLRGALSRINDWGIRIPAGCRPLRAIDTLNRSDRTNTSSSSDPNVTQREFEALRLALELYTGIYGSSVHPSDQMRIAIQHALAGPDLRCADPATRRQFRRYWRVVAPGSGLIRRAILAQVRREAMAGVG